MSWLLLVLIAGLYIAFVLAIFRFSPTPRSRTPSDRFLSGAMSRIALNLPSSGCHTFGCAP